MKVVLTAQSLKHLEKSLRFFVEVLQIPKPQVVKIKKRLLKVLEVCRVTLIKVNTSRI